MPRPATLPVNRVYAFLVPGPPRGDGVADSRDEERVRLRSVTGVIEARPESERGHNKDAPS